MNGFTLDSGQRDLRDRLNDIAQDAGTPRSLYIHGPAGRGKTWIANTTFEALPTSRKARVHFHGFLAALHRCIHHHRSDEDALGRAIDDIAGDSHVLFFDEFHVHDSGDARLLTRLLDRLFRRGVTVIATSNYAPDDLLPSPIWHHLFEPGIRLIKANMDVFHLDGPTDYRTLPQDHSRGFASGTWTTASPARHPAPAEATTITVRDRQFSVLASRPDALWATFAQLCEAPIATIEYLEWARVYPRWVVTEVPTFAAIGAPAQQRFINMIDVLADADVPVTFVSPHTRDAFLAGTSARPDAFRMVSRLQLLQSAA
ncbi:cell division protein ZapE [Microbacterium sp. A93]|uniref:cell division protein ZapE n=1 Tax=Microbacterium sp. A93 TaxID=3450716 RepID=UPI003F43E32F